MSKQLSHEQINFKQTEFPIILFADRIFSEANAGSLLRLADAFGIEKIIFAENFPNLNSNRLKRTARNTQNTVKIDFEDNAKNSLKVLKQNNYKIISLEITQGSKTFSEIVLQEREKIVLIAGNERHGISEKLLNLSDEICHIEMFGENSSMNVAQSVAIGLYEISKAIKEFRKK
ncbi:TrmH family RNA methyltransferase [Gramella sp. AN32]|uniref:TrmH family RNA methyltransferase n=1 Tax=Christiangramia antarctica TaxID=2058158 RepID=A0ABW5WXZ4_9FLAO|nr:TrmH family RNA methyltransferase [Gramella sp. AN32]MCM4156772.1 RNA methyltransferase [Gramella sp. AN32]